jgi:hypothetical protein
LQERQDISASGGFSFQLSQGLEDLGFRVGHGDWLPGCGRQASRKAVNGGKARNRRQEAEGVGCVRGWRFDRIRE